MDQIGRSAVCHGSYGEDVHWRTLHHPGGEHVYDEPTVHTPESALTELQRKLDDKRAQYKLTHDMLGTRTGLSRQTVQAALSKTGKVPSSATVAALASALSLPEDSMLDLRRIAARKDGEGGRGPGPGRLIGQWDPYVLEVHPAGTVQDGLPPQGERLLPGYVEREHDRILADAVNEARLGGSRMLVLVGSSSTGKTRACWEAVQPLTDAGWRLWHPFDPTRAAAALADLHRVGPQTVVWLNEAQHYLGDPGVGEEIAAAVHRLLTDPLRGPVLVLGTLWPDYAQQYAALPEPGKGDPRSRVRELLAGRTVHVPEAFDAAALATAAQKAEEGDRLLADALNRAGADGRLAQDLAGGPALLERYHSGSPAARALLEAAMDARRLGVSLHLPQAFLTDAAPDYIHDTDWNRITDDWAEAAYAELAHHVHGKQAPLTRITPRPHRRAPGPPPTDTPSPHTPGPVFRLADYLEQYGRTKRRHLCPPASFWHAAHAHLTHPDDLDNLFRAADARYRLQWAHHLRLRAADRGNPAALAWLARMRQEAGDLEGAETLYRKAADHGDTLTLARLVRMREQAGDQDGAETLARKAADRGNPDALVELGQMREEAGDLEGAETFYRKAADHGHTFSLFLLAGMRERAGDLEGTETLYRKDIFGLARLAQIREKAGDSEGAETLARKAADHGNPDALVELGQMREKAGDLSSADALYRRAADLGKIDAQFWLVRMRERAGDQELAETLALQFADRGNPDGLIHLVRTRERAGNHAGAETFARKAANHGNLDALVRLFRMRERAGDLEGAEALYREAAFRGNPEAMVQLAEIRERAGDLEEAETFARRAADHGHTFALIRLAEIRKNTGDHAGGETLARQIADHGYPNMRGALGSLDGWWPYGLDPDGTPSLAWQ
ncbi:hypothetical protein [Streptomyces sp. NPDC096142]|uniref:hypothetical protein n=1 Tax=Streptomyces sp. NPDC096142 TaxID=3366077 RepID=UPI0037FEEB04